MCKSRHLSRLFYALTVFAVETSTQFDWLLRVAVCPLCLVHPFQLVRSLVLTQAFKARLPQSLIKNHGSRIREV